MTKKSFHVAAVDSFERTFRAIFQQADEEVDRLDRINSAMSILEAQLLDPERIGEMDTMQQIALMELLSRSQQSTIRNIMGFHLCIQPFTKTDFNHFFPRCVSLFVSLFVSQIDT